jgi:hypothetical protein
VCDEVEKFVVKAVGRMVESSLPITEMASGVDMSLLPIDMGLLCRSRRMGVVAGYDLLLNLAALEYPFYLVNIVVGHGNGDLLSLSIDTFSLVALLEDVCNSVKKRGTFNGHYSQQHCEFVVSSSLTYCPRKPTASSTENVPS